MITLTTEQAQQIEEALVSQWMPGNDAQEQAHDKALATIRAARAQAQEPVAFQFPRDTESWTGGWTIDHKVIRSVDAEIEDNEFKPCLESVEQVLLALEKVYAAPQPMKQEPVAWMHKCGGVCSAYDKEHMFGLDYFNIPLYAAPVRTKDLTDAELNNLWVGSTKGGWIGLFRAVIAADREKNK